MKTKIIILLILAVSLFSGCKETLWIQKDFNNIRESIDTVSIIFPQIEYSERNGEVSITKSGYSYYVSKQISEVIKEIVDSRKFVSLSASIVFDSTVIGGWMQSRYSSSKTIYTLIRDSVQKVDLGPKIVPQIPELQTLINEVHTRYFILVAGYSYGTTETTKRFEMIQEQTFNRIYGINQAYKTDWFGTVLQIMLADSRTREILWYNYNPGSDSRYDPLNKGEMKNLCMELLTAK